MFDSKAVEHKATLDTTKTNFDVALWDLTLAKKSFTDLSTELAQAIKSIEANIAKLEADRDSAVAVASAAARAAVAAGDIPPAELSMHLSDIEYTSSKYSAIIETLRVKIEQLREYSLEVTEKSKRVDLGIERLTSGISSLENLEGQLPGFAYVSLRLGTFASTVSQYRAEVAFNDKDAAANLSHGLNYFDSEQGKADVAGLVAFAESEAANALANPLPYGALNVVPPLTQITFGDGTPFPGSETYVEDGEFSGDGVAPEESGGSDVPIVPIPPGEDPGEPGSSSSVEDQQATFDRLHSEQNEINARKAQLEQLRKDIVANMYIDENSPSSAAEALGLDLDVTGDVTPEIMLKKIADEQSILDEQIIDINKQLEAAGWTP